jgi:hypothetical protein
MKEMIDAPLAYNKPVHLEQIEQLFNSATTIESITSIKDEYLNQYLKNEISSAFFNSVLNFYLAALQNFEDRNERYREFRQRYEQLADW